LGRRRGNVVQNTFISLKEFIVNSVECIVETNARAPFECTRAMRGYATPEISLLIAEALKRLHLNELIAVDSEDASWVNLCSSICFFGKSFTLTSTSPSLIETCRPPRNRPSAFLFSSPILCPSAAARAVSLGNDNLHAANCK
jgi:hypothetical protein